jgi:hypothetical protein
MLAISRALLANPRLVIMDEPSEGLAPVIVDHLVQVLRALPGEGMALLLVEQNLGVATEVCPEVAIMVNGRIATRMASSALLADEAMQRRFLGVAPAAITERRRRMSKVYVIGTGDTKAAELRFAKSVVEAAGVPAVLVDVGTRDAMAGADVPAAEVARHHPDGAARCSAWTTAGGAVAGMAEALGRFLAARDDIGAVLGLGGSGNTALVTAACAACRRGAEADGLHRRLGQHAPYVGPNDIAMMYSVADVAGLNAITRRVIGNAAHAVAGMAKWAVPEASGDKPGLGMTMFGVTTACCTMAREALEAEYDVYTFHATGTGGQSMEKLAESGLVRGMLDITTTEVPDFLMGGVFPAPRTASAPFRARGCPTSARSAPATW